MAVVLALLVCGGWWLVRGPMVGKPVAPVPDVDIDLDSPTVRVAGNPSDAASTGLPRQWAVAASAGRAKPAATAASAESCGPDDGPKYAEPEPRDGVMAMDEIRGAGPGYIEAQARLDAALRSSADPFDHAVADLLNAGDARTPTGRIDALVQQALATSDPRVYSVAVHTCLAASTRAPALKMSGVVPPSCAALTTRRWAALDPGNGVPWLAVLMQAHADKDTAAESDALAHLAAASRFGSHSMDVQAAVASHVPANDPRLGAHLMAGALGGVERSLAPVERGAAPAKP